MTNKSYIKLKHEFWNLLQSEKKLEFKNLKYYYLEINNDNSIKKRQLNIESFNEKIYFIKKMNDSLVNFIEKNHIQFDNCIEHSYIAYTYYRFLNCMIEYVYKKYSKVSSLEVFHIYAVRVIETSYIISKQKIKLSSLWFKDDGKDIYEKFFIQQFFINLKQIEYEKTELNKIVIGSTGSAYPYVAIKNDESIYPVRYESSIQLKDLASNEYDKKLNTYFRHNKHSSIYNVYFGKTFKTNKENSGKGNFDLVHLDDPLSNKKYKLNRTLIDSMESTDGIVQINNETDIEKIAANRKSYQTNKLENLQDSIKQFNESQTDRKHIISSQKLKEIKKSKRKIAIIDAMIKQKQIKSNFYLRSNYYIPVAEMLSEFLQENYNGTIEAKLIILSIVLGIEYDQILLIILNQHKIIKYKQTKRLLEIELTSQYGGVSDSELYELFETNEKIIKIELPLIIISLIKEIKKELSDENSEVIQKSKEQEITTNKYIEKQIDKFLKKAFKYTIVLKRMYLHMYSINYYIQTYDTSYSNLLFILNKTKNMHTELAYVSSSKYQHNTSHWLVELMTKLKIDKIFDTLFEDFSTYSNTEYSGSNRIMKPGTFKEFVTLINSLDFPSKYEQLNVKMICIRYLLAIQLTTREYTYSANLKALSRRDMILFIDEKAKDLINGKRIIPLTKAALKTVDCFYNLKKEFKIEHYVPSLYINKQYIPFTNSQVTQWLEDHKDFIVKKLGQNDYNFLHTTSKNDLNFGRHIFKSFEHGMNTLKHDYSEALMNHHLFGNNPHGKYSILDKQSYLKESIKIITEIEQLYIPYLDWLK